ncbi:ABC transporter substrate-binding protein [Nocardia sp. NPDC059239]|uniref:ABC transporter substrate-binding protein n=1 Tax=Nocardia sp. NPDC059239 TaxID=3346785 RepID=UPI0036BEB668
MSTLAPSRRTFITGSLAAAGMLGLAACGGGFSNTGGRTTLNFWINPPGSVGLPTMQGLVDEFEKTNPDIKVKLRTFTGYAALLQAVQSSVAAGQPPDVAQIGYNYINYAAKAYPMVSLDDLGVKLDGYPRNILAMGQSGGRQVGAPYGLSDLVVYYNADVLGAAGLDATKPPSTWEQWRQAAAAIKASQSMPAITFQRFPGDNYILQTMTESNGGSILGCSNGIYSSGVASAESVQAVEFMVQLIKDGLSLEVQTAQASQSFLAGQTATLITGSSSTQTLRQQAGFRLDIAPLPSFGTKPRRIPGGGNSLCSFAKTAAGEQAAGKLISFLTSANSFETWVQKTGYLSPREGVARERAASDKFISVAEAQMADLVPWASFPGPKGLQGSQVLDDAVTAILGGQTDARAGLTEAARKLNELIGSEHC